MHDAGDLQIFFVLDDIYIVIIMREPYYGAGPTFPTMRLYFISTCLIFPSSLKIFLQKKFISALGDNGIGNAYAHDAVHNSSLIYLSWSPTELSYGKGNFTQGLSFIPTFVTSFAHISRTYFFD